MFLNYTENENHALSARLYSRRVQEGGRESATREYVLVEHARHLVRMVNPVHTTSDAVYCIQITRALIMDHLLISLPTVRTLRQNCTYELITITYHRIPLTFIYCTNSLTNINLLLTMQTGVLASVLVYLIGIHAFKQSMVD